MLNKKEIEKRLKGVDQQLCMAFAARCSVWQMPLLVADIDKDAFWYWDKEKQPKTSISFYIV